MTPGNSAGKAAVEAPEFPASSTSYDEVPYKSYPYPQTRPERLATVAAIFGLKTAPVDRCRVLELGSSSGGNLIPAAEQLAESQFVGIDASSREIADGQAIVQRLGLRNIRLERRNILDITADFGQFDYIIAHGVYSWVPNAVQEKLLEVCRANLAPNGVAYVSYNTYPGWHMRGIIRDMMCYRAQAFQKPADQIRQARALIEFLAQSVPKEDNAYGIMLRNELNAMRGKEDHYLFHDHLEKVNEPVYFHQFMDRAQAKGLQYLGEAEFGSMSLKNFSQQIEAVVQSVASNLIEIEQYMDFVRNRMFRQTLLCHADVALDRSVSPDRVLGLYVASPAKPESPVTDVKTSAKVVFKGPHAVTTTTDPLMKAAMLHLGAIWPQYVAFPELVATARSRINPEPAVVDTAQITADSRKLAEPLLRCYASNQVELSVRAAPYTLQPSERPVGPPSARLQVEASNRATNFRHESVQLNDLQRQVLRCLDGQHDRAAILEFLQDLCLRGVLVVHEHGQAVKDATQIKGILEKPLDAALTMLGRLAMLRA